MLLILGSCCDLIEDRTGVEAERGYAIDQLFARAEGSLTLRPYHSVVELLPNVSYVGPTGDLGPLTDAVVVGDITDVSPGRAVRDGGREPEPLRFDDPAADWRTLHLHVRVTDTIAGSAARNVLVELPIGGTTDAETMAAGLRQIGPLLFFLWGPTPAVDDDSSVYSLVEGGDLLATVEHDGSIRFLVTSMDEDADLVGGIRTVDDLKRAAAQPPRVIAVDDVGERVG